MQVLNTPSGDFVAIMKPSELALADVAMTHYLVGPGADSSLAARMERDLVEAIEVADRREEGAALAEG
nr:hypothetical protein OH820_15145 [Streptomyces sp. NBC_00857]